MSDKNSVLQSIKREQVETQGLCWWTQVCPCLTKHSAPFTQYHEGGSFPVMAGSGKECGAVSAKEADDVTGVK